MKSNKITKRAVRVTRRYDHHRTIRASRFRCHVLIPRPVSRIVTRRYTLPANILLVFLEFPFRSRPYPRGKKKEGGREGDVTKRVTFHEWNSQKLLLENYCNSIVLHFAPAFSSRSHWRIIESRVTRVLILCHIFHINLLLFRFFLLGKIDL